MRRDKVGPNRGGKSEEKSSSSRSVKKRKSRGTEPAPCVTGEEKGTPFADGRGRNQGKIRSRRPQRGEKGLTRTTLFFAKGGGREGRRVHFYIQERKKDGIATVDGKTRMSAY